MVMPSSSPAQWAHRRQRSPRSNYWRGAKPFLPKPELKRSRWGPGISEAPSAAEAASNPLHFINNIKNIGTPILMNLARCTLSLLLITACGLWAQSTGSLRGLVSDPSGAGIPGATVSLTGPANTVKVATTDSTGNYIIVGLPGGQYTVRVAAPGFTLFEKTNLDLTTGRGSTLDVPLTVAVEKQEVTVADTQSIQVD